MNLKALPLLVLLLSLSAFAQTTYTMPGTFVCDAASVYPVQYFSQFDCRGIKLEDSTETVIGDFFLFNPNEIEIGLPGFTANPYLSKTTSSPAGPLPSTFQFTWQATDTNGVTHTGTATVTWQDHRICGGRGCYWHAPKLLSFQTTVD